MTLPSPAGWVEPAARLALRWGNYRGRVVAGLVLIIGGLVHLQSASTLVLVPLTARHRPWRNFVALAISAVVLTGSAWWAWALARPAQAGAIPTATP